MTASLELSHILSLGLIGSLLTNALKKQDEASETMGAIEDLDNACAQVLHTYTLVHITCTY